jgi:outer membrane lipoprotein-sorting protein
MHYYMGKVCSVKTIAAAILLILLPTFVHAENIDEIIKKVVENLNGKTAVMEISMAVKTNRTKRTMKMKSYSVGQEKSFIKVLYPKKDKGITFLKVDNSMWQYVPRIEKIIKIPASMMLQSWMGSDFSNDDLVKESSMYDDYTHELISETDEAYTVNLHPKVEAAVVWGKITMSVSKEYYLPMAVSYFDEDGNLVRELVYTDVKPYGDRFYPSVWVMTPKSEDKVGHETRIIVSQAIFDSEVDEGYFSKRALKRFSK